MLTRRAALAGGAAVALTASSPASAATVPQVAVAFSLPPGSCDSHVHVVGDPTRYPMSPQRDYTPPPATADQLAKMLAVMHLDRVVIVTPTIYDTDNSATIDALRQLGLQRARGIAIVDEDAAPDSFARLAASGIAGVRVFLGGGSETDAQAIKHRLQHFGKLAAEQGWHLDVFTPPDVVAAVAEPIASCPVPLVFDYFAWLSGGIQQDGFGAIASLMKSGHAYVKLSEPYRISKLRPNYNNLMPLVQAFVAANAERVLWGSGWPHVDSGSVPGRKNTDTAPDLPEDAGHLLNLLGTWVPDQQVRHKILVENPARLYRF
jgi:predicted TIM-barrel fold metal-dependent hydrolase